MKLPVATLLLGLAAPAAAQSWTSPHAELPSAQQPVRRVATTGYTLSLIWTPEECRGARLAGSECRAPTRDGFILHGLWPDGAGPNLWPQYCHPVAILNDQQIRAGFRDTPSAQLLQHEWAKHGSCITGDPAGYFAREDRLFERLRFPDMAALAARRDLTASAFQAAFAAANPGMSADMMRLNANRSGWLQEVWLCLGPDFAPRRCAADAGGANPDQHLKVAAPHH